ncbi:MAG: efflux RND transporter periplasmic adaptor subunit [Bacteroidia bacterium]|nr:efflux RND transporter periplasmic adaptor subunit [Bacteroidia bacterium]
MRFTKYLVLIICCTAACTKKVSQNNSKPKTPPTVSVQIATPVAIDNVIHTTGTLQANESIEIRPETNGIITTINFIEGKPIRAGQVLLKINDDDLIAEKKKAQVALNFARENAGRNAKLLAIEAISNEDFDRVVNELKKAEAECELIEAQLAKKIIKAPFNGIMGLRNVSVGQYVASGTLLATLNQVHVLKVNFAIPEKYVQQVKVGNTISFTVAGDTTNFDAKIYAIDNSIDETTRSVMVRALSNNPDGKLHAGSFAKVAVSLGSVPDAIMIPADVLMPELDGNKIYVLSNGKAIAHKVSTGIRNETSIEIVSGMHAGDTLITSGLLMLKDSMDVKPVFK